MKLKAQQEEAARVVACLLQHKEEYQAKGRRAQNLAGGHQPLFKTQQAQAGPLDRQGNAQEIMSQNFTDAIQRVRLGGQIS